jgi:hypothetical protein
LAEPYPVAISGTLTLGVASGSLPADPAVQFSTGGRSVAFVIPANSTQATFGTQGTQIGLQTGTVASNVELTPSFATQAGNVDLTPPSPSLLRFTVAQAAPTLISARLVSQSTTSFVIGITGFTTTRTLTNLQVRFTPATGVNLGTSQFTLDLQQIAATWFRATASQAFGGQFAVSIPFNLQGTLPDGNPAINGISSISVSANNEVGASNPLEVRLRE